MIKLLNVSALSYSGTTWLNLLLGSHPQVLTIGPPHRLVGMLDGDLGSACLIHGADCGFWPAFARQRDPQENLLTALARFSGRSVFVVDNAPADFIQKHAHHPDIQVIPGYYIRDGRAISASYARKVRKKGISYVDSISPDGWLYPSFQNLPSRAELTRSGMFFARYEDVVVDPETFLANAGRCLGIEYTRDAHRFWEWDHHITSGNQGPIAMVRLHQAIPVGSFESYDVYAEQLQRLKLNPFAPFVDERWKTQLNRDELLCFDQMMGEKNAALGYERDTFSNAETKTLAAGFHINKPSRLRAHVKALAKRLLGRNA